MLFETVAQEFAAIEVISERLKITAQLSGLLAKASPQEANMIVNLSLGQLYPVYKMTQFLIGEKVMLEILAEFFSLPRETVEQTTHRLSNVFELFLHSDKCFNKKLSVTQIFQELIVLEKTVGNGSVEIKTKHLLTLFSSVDAQSADLIVRIIIGKLRLGFSHMTIIDALTKQYDDTKSTRAIIEHAYSISADLGGIAEQFKEKGIDAIKKRVITIGVPIVPAAAERVSTIAEIVERINPVIVQPKYDGMRVQIHCSWHQKVPKIFMFSRHLRDISLMFPEFFDCLTAYQGSWKTIIFEGEVIAYDPNTGVVLPFQETAKRKRKYNIASVMEEIPLKMIAFDLLYSNGQSCFFKHHQERRAELEAFIKSLQSNSLITVTEEITATDEHTISDYFYTQLDKGLEGIIAKKSDVPYTPGKRNFNWIKFKRSNSAHLNDTIDAVIVGYYYGKGKRASFGIGALLVALFDSASDRFETVARVGTGISDDEWILFKQQLDQDKVDQRPKELICDKSLYPDVWVAPRMVIMVKADEITLSSVHSAGKQSDKAHGYALRFPRFVQLVEDKEPDQITTTQEIKRLYSMQIV